MLLRREEDRHDNRINHQVRLEPDDYIENIHCLRPCLASSFISDKIAEIAGMTIPASCRWHNSTFPTPQPQDHS